MNTSLRLLLEDFLGLMREEGELDVFLALLLSGMGHEVVYRAQKGVRQYGVDLSSVGIDEADGQKKLFLWVVKRGDIGRTEWNSGPQTILPSLNDLVWVYLRSHVSPQHASLPKKAVVLTNGDFNSALNETISSTFATLSEQHPVQFEQANGSRLAAWSEKYLLDEHLLPSDSRSLLRRMLVNIAAPELSLRSGRDLVRQLTGLATTEGGSANAKKKRQLGALRGIRTALSLARIYGLNENDMTVAYRLSEYAVLQTWAALNAEAGTVPYVGEEFAAIRLQWSELGYEYHERLRSYYQTQDAFATALPDSVLVSDRVFIELGRLGLQALHWGSLGAQTGTPQAINLAHYYGARIDDLLETHGASGSPPYDSHSAAIHAALTGMLIVNRRQRAEKWLELLIVRLAHAVRNLEYWPLSADFESALAVRWGEVEVTDETASVSTLVPVLLTWAAAMGRDDLYGALRSKVVSALPKWCTMNMWSSEAGYDAVVGDYQLLNEHGIAEAILHIPETAAEYIARMSVPLDGTTSPGADEWFRQGVPFVPVLAALHFGAQVPRLMLLQHAVALCSGKHQS